MTELRTNDTYQLPTSPEASLDLASGSQLTETEAALAEVMLHAGNTHNVDPNDVDHHRIEGDVGGTAVSAAVEAAATAQVEIFFDPTNMAQLIACGLAVYKFRMKQIADARAQLNIK